MRRGLLVRHFVRRFSDNDLISPDADRHDVLAVSVAALSMSGLFLAVLVSMAYLFRPVQSRGWTALASLQDTFIWCGFSMILMSLVALAAWDGLTLDARDTSILSVLPVRRGRVVGAQLIAVLLFGLGFVVCVTAVPTLVVPLIRVSRLPIGTWGIARLIGAHAGATMSAGAFGFLSVIAVRETLRTLLAGGWFERVAPIVQGVLVALLATCFLLLPALGPHVYGRWLLSPSTAPPPMWFVGVHELLAGDALVGLPATNPPADAPNASAIRDAESRMLRRYESARPALSALAARSVTGLGTVFAIAAVAWIYNSRRWPQLVRGRSFARGRTTARVLRALDRHAAAAPLERAGFAFARQTLGRSVTHRVRMAASLGAAVACAAVCLRGVLLQPAVGLEELPVAAVAMQTIVLMIVAAGYRQTTRVPADVRAGVTFAIAGFDDGRRFVHGVKRAGIVLVLCPVIVLLWPLHASFLGWRLASAHLLCGLLTVLVLMEGLFLNEQNLPLVSPQEPSGNGLALASVYGAVALLTAWALASAERLTFDSLAGTAALNGVLLAGWLGLVVASRRAASEHHTPSLLYQADAAQRLGLSE